MLARIRELDIEIHSLDISAVIRELLANLQMVISYYLPQLCQPFELVSRIKHRVFFSHYA